MCVAAAAGFVVLIAGHLIAERSGALRAAAAGIAGAAFAFASEPWENATRADVHAVNVLFVTIVIWLLFTWRAARAGRVAARRRLAGGRGAGVRPRDRRPPARRAARLRHRRLAVRRRSRPLAPVAPGRRSAGSCLPSAWSARTPTSGSAPISDPEPPLFYARPDTWERFRYLVFAEQFSGLFRDFRAPLVGPAATSGPTCGASWRPSSSRRAGCWSRSAPPSWLPAASGTFAVLFLFVLGNVVYSMNFNDGDIDRYYMPTIVVLAPLLGVAVAAIGAACARAVAEVGRRLFTTGRGAPAPRCPGRRRRAGARGRACRMRRW